ncbi:TRAP-type C4-dicarboxylate transport system permease small subunit [Geomicrobium halophilum]|uniref:TRAP-type C4-dicarboxylate transport system permease small subunit n=1 Tax=Geomicrobium halophilum TaxID=549000 RepID=A0A841PIS4_9BACL|nr:TRAP transporter small permease [Geomicrobium halophilum]MBB6448700.1 TRAP-type C4-dicarboxylate transport system permease small subunit [Geomicrobium halophilum]
MKLVKLLRNIDDYIITIAISGTIIVVSANIFFRYVLNSPITWTEEVSVAFFTLVTFFGMSSAMKRNEHIGIDYFVRKLPDPISYLFQWIRLIAIFGIILFVFIYLGFQLALDSNAQTSILGISYIYIYLSIPLGGLLALIHLTYVIVTRNKDFIKYNKGAY